MVLFLSIAIVVAFVLWGIFFPEQLAERATEMLNFTTEKFGWFYLLVTIGFIVFILFLAFSKYGRLRLGSDQAEPEYSNLSWFSMLFSAGMGIGLVFWGVAEPMQHFLSPPMGVPGETAEAARLSMRYAFFHWGIHPWAIYTTMGLALAYFQFRQHRKGLISETFVPLLGDRTNGAIGKTIDTLAVIATAFGIATSLGLGALQINGGLRHLFDVPNSATVQIWIIGVVTILFLISAMTGLNKGIQLLSNLNMWLILILLLLVLFIGPTSFLFDTLTVSLGEYLQNFIYMSFRLTPFTGATWVRSWTLFYWAWWIAWAPFVGTFIARISKGRTIREFVLGVLIVPSVFSFVWFSVFGGTGLHMEMFRGVQLSETVADDLSAALFTMLAHLPVGTVLAVIATILIITFFITSADSATFVLGMLSTGGNLNPANGVKFIWGILQSSIAVVLLLSHGLEALQTASIVTALPFAVIMALMCASLLKALSQEKNAKAKPKA